MLSIITITFKDPHGFRATLDSLKPLQCTSLRWEHVVVDSSPEENEPVFSSLGKDWPLVRVKVAPEGIYPAFNMGLKQAKGDLTWFLNGGDRLKSVDDLQSLLEAFQADPTLDIICALADLERNGEYMYTHAQTRTLLGGLWGANRLCHQAILYRRSALDRVGPFSTRYQLASDYEHHFRCYLSRLKIRFTARCIVVFDMAGQSSAYARVFEEFKGIHRDLRRQLPFWISLGNEVIRPLERARVGMLKGFAASPLAGVLRPVWLSFKRRS